MTEEIKPFFSYKLDNTYLSVKWMLIYNKNLYCESFHINLAHDDLNKSEIAAEIIKGIQRIVKSLSDTCTELLPSAPVGEFEHTTEELKNSLSSDTFIVDRAEDIVPHIIENEKMPPWLRLILLSLSLKDGTIDKLFPAVEEKWDLIRDLERDMEERIKMKEEVNPIYFYSLSPDRMFRCYCISFGWAFLYKGNHYCDRYDYTYHGDPYSDSYDLSLPKPGVNDQQIIEKFLKITMYVSDYCKCNWRAIRATEQPEGKMTDFEMKVKYSAEWKYYSADINDLLPHLMQNPLAPDFIREILKKYSYPVTTFTIIPKEEKPLTARERAEKLGIDLSKASEEETIEWIGSVIEEFCEK